jgi:hypothetical protein
MLTERQQLAKRLADELGKLDGVWITSPLPLDESRKLNLQILDNERNRVLQIIRDWGWDPVAISVLPRVHTTGLLAACLWEIDLPKPRQEIPQDRIPQDEIGKRKQHSYEAQAVIDQWYGVKK